MSLGKTWRRRKPLRKAFLPWPGFFLLDQYLPDRLLSVQAEGFGPLQIAGQGSGPYAMLQFWGHGLMDPLSPIKIAPQQHDNDQGAKGNVRQHIRRPCAHGAAAAKAQPAVPPHPNRSQGKLPQGLHPSPVSAMGVKTPRVTEALVTNCGLLRSTAICTPVQKEQLRSKYQPILKTRYKTHETTPCPRF